MSRFPHIEELLFKRETAANYSDNQRGAALPTFGLASEGLKQTKIGYIALKTLRSAALASDNVIWKTFGDIISNWKGPQAGSRASAVEQELDFVSRHRQGLSADNEEKLLGRIRCELASCKLQIVSPGSRKEFTNFASDEDEEWLMSAALHIRRDDTASTIYILPALLSMEYWLNYHNNAPEDVKNAESNCLAIMVAKSIVHESRHMVATLLFGTQYQTPPLIQGNFPPPVVDTNDADVQGEAGDYFEVSRYGTTLSASLVALNSKELSQAEMYLIGVAPHTYTWRRLHRESAVAPVADAVEKGKFLEMGLFFDVMSSDRIRGGDTTFNHEDIIQVTCSDDEYRTYTQNRTLRRSVSQVPHASEERPEWVGKSVSEIPPAEMRRYIIGNHRGVVMGRRGHREM
ncbi:hypothetical protein MIND_01182800 [Mycena indigotica]|uniref:Uncharacterized protein n=1 Tax=Mycena indigotica TaxID=2126181 RepID=A0A8H6S5R2_9AGAR|nr:uncharacterized protein MIND_01182800 [Mycena indigotica]KAF7292838.1 hypothetical protein MIND_01182800 [Mycena indigotica]